MSTAASSEFSAELLTRLVELGLEHVVICPGARSQALALVAAQLETRGDLKVHVRYDERVGAFAALGIGVESDKPAAVITTSGSAVANVFPAVLEAHHSGVPLIVLTADRPEELHGIGSNQTTRQKDFFGKAVRLSLDEPAPEQSLETQDRAQAIANKLWSKALDSSGPVHANLAFREPLSSPVELRDIVAEKEKTRKKASRDVVDIPQGSRTLIIAGTGSGEVAEDIAHQGQWPLIAEITSGARFGRNLVAAYRDVLGNTELVDQIERVVIFGRPTLSREIPQFISQLPPHVEVVGIRSPGAEPFNPGHRIHNFVEGVRVTPGSSDTSWLMSWITAGREHAQQEENNGLLDPSRQAPQFDSARSDDLDRRKEFLASELAASKTPVSRELLVDAVWRATWPHDRLVFAASRLIRVADRHVPGKKITVYANRGLSGIDGNISTAQGIALAAYPALTRVVVGDIAAIHDLGSFALSPQESAPRLQVIIGRDGGGSMFDLLEVRQSSPPDEYDRVMFTPHNVDFSHIAKAFRWEYVTVATVGDLERALTGYGDTPQIIDVSLVR